MNKHAVIVELPEKQKAARTAAFRQRILPKISELASAFYERNELVVKDTVIAEIAELIVDDIIDTLEQNPDFARVRLDPSCSTDEAVLEKLCANILEACEHETPFQFLLRDGPTTPAEGSCEKTSRRRATR